MLHISALPDLLALAGIVGGAMASSSARNHVVLSFPPHCTTYRTILTAPQQKSHGRESLAPVRFP
jgi:hypothetical protein